MDLSYDVEEANFEELVVARSHDVPVLLDISAEWCSPCRVLTPMLEKLVKEYNGKFVLANVDADENMRIAGRHQAKGFPTVIAYSHGQGIDRFHSVQTEGFLRRFLDSFIERHAAGSAAGKMAPHPA
ncbi:MAG: thioredoxin domain-containing protein [Sulfuricella sp.]|nr:thioredoxin domain-containing protein [Sulfuricella sp.]